MPDETTSASEMGTTSGDAEEPRVLDTYALFYAFALLFLVPGSIMAGSLQFRTYTFSYVSLVTVPFVLGLLAVLLTDSADGLRRKLARSLVLVPLVIVTGVGVLFGSALFVVPASNFIVPENFGVLTWVAVALLVAVAAPLVPALLRRIVRRQGLREIVQTIAIAAAIAVVVAVVGITLAAEGSLDDFARKDVVIYIIGGLTWYLPAFGIAAGAWRRVGLV